MADLHVLKALEEDAEEEGEDGRQVNQVHLVQNKLALPDINRYQLSLLLIHLLLLFTLLLYIYLSILLLL